MRRSRSAEFSFLVLCCRWPADQALRCEIKRRGSSIDWDRLVRLAARHRVEGLVQRAICEAGVEPPAPLAALLEASAARIRHQNLLSAAESVTLYRRFEEAGVQAIFVKGVTLGQLAYGDISRKAGWDIDLLVAPEDLAATIALLRHKGYSLQGPFAGMTIEDLPRWHRYSKESIWRSQNGVTWVELHTALADNPSFLPGIGPHSPRQSVEVSPGIFLPTLAREELFAYLCVHGASSVWFRLKWIADFAALIGIESEAEIERLYRRALELGAGRAAALALLLSRALFRTPITPKLWRELKSDWMSRWLVGLALRKLTGRAGEVELEEVKLGTASIHVAQLGLMHGWRFKRIEMFRQLVSPIDRVATPLPWMLEWIYPAVQAVRVIRGARRN